MADKEELMAPEGAVWVCGACGKVAKHMYGDAPGDPYGWDEACILNAVLCEETDVVKQGRTVTEASAFQKKET